MTKKYIHDHIQSSFQFNDHVVLDFGSGTGANCSMFTPGLYIGVDPDEKRIDYARRLYPEHSFQVLQNNRLPIDDRKVDYILIVAVLHHISSEEISLYMDEFRRILKPSGTIIVMEPCLCSRTPICNRFMKWYDKGDYIREEEDYIHLFASHDYECTVLKRFRKCFLYNELFFSAAPKLAQTMD
ncbi:class I SAM-dependent methyltransferase [Paenibacillus turpanensis]|uniref:class I SAM-dependent methyltransferase n=1 Tax=Paenibacillus turpanensis TaxID=2689078 RepID=UPI0031331D81